MGIIPNTFIILNHSDELVNKCCLDKIKDSEGYYSHIP